MIALAPSSEYNHISLTIKSGMNSSTLLSEYIIEILYERFYIGGKSDKGIRHR